MKIGSPANAANIGELLMRGMGVVGDLPDGIPPDFSLTLGLEDFTRPEFRWLRKIRAYGASMFVAAPGGATFSVFELSLRSSLDSGQWLASIDQLILHNRNAATVEFAWGITTVDPTLAFTNTVFGPRDDRQPAQGIASAYHIGGANNEAGQPALIDDGGTMHYRLLANESVVIPVEYVLTGRSRLVIWDTGTNSACGVSVRWTERQMLSSEV